MQKTFLPRKKILKIFQDQNIRDLLNKIIEKYQEMVNSYFLEDYQGVLVQIGKYDELFYSLLDYLTRKKIPTKISFKEIDKRLNLEISKGNLPSSLLSFLSRSLRLSYKFRNSRDGAHVNDFIANRIDSLLVINNAQWCLAELIRTYSNLSMEEGLSLVNDIIELPTPIIQRFGDKTLVLRKTSASNEILIILFYRKENQLNEKELKNMIVNHSNHSIQNVTTSLNNLKDKRMVFRDNETCFLTFEGKKYVTRLIQKGGI